MAFPLNGYNPTKVHMTIEGYKAGNSVTERFFTTQIDFELTGVGANGVSEATWEQAIDDAATAIEAALAPEFTDTLILRKGYSGFIPPA